MKVNHRPLNLYLYDFKRMIEIRANKRGATYKYWIPRLPMNRRWMVLVVRETQDGHESIGARIRDFAGGQWVTVVRNLYARIRP